MPCGASGIYIISNRKAIYRISARKYIERAEASISTPFLNISQPGGSNSSRLFHSVMVGRAALPPPTNYDDHSPKSEGPATDHRRHCEGRQARGNPHLSGPPGPGDAPHRRGYGLPRRFAARNDRGNRDPVLFAGGAAVVFGYTGGTARRPFPTILLVGDGHRAVPRFISPLDFFAQCAIIVSENTRRVRP